MRLETHRRTVRTKAGKGKNDGTANGKITLIALGESETSVKSRSV